MTNSAKIRDTINAQLALPAPAAAALGPTPTLLKPKQEKAAIAFNRSKLRDPRSIRAIQAFIGATPDGVFNADTVQRVANFQNGAGLKEDGQIGRITINPLVMGWPAPAVRTAPSGPSSTSTGWTRTAWWTSISTPLTPTMRRRTDQAIPGNSRITVSPNAFTQGFAGLVHTVAHEFEHVRQNRAGIADLRSASSLANESRSCPRAWTRRTWPDS